MIEQNKDSQSLPDAISVGFPKAFGSPVSTVILLLIVLCGLVLTALVVTAKKYTVDARLHEKYSGSLRSLIALDAQLNEAVLKTSSGMSVSYDPLQRLLRQLHSQSVELQNTTWPIPYFPQEGSVSVEKSLTEFLSLLADKEVLIEKFQTETSVVRNSHNYFPVGVRQLVDARQKESKHDPLSSSLHELLQCVSLYTLLPNPEHSVACLHTLASLQQNLHVLSGTDQQEVRLLLLHAQVILDREQRLSEAVRSVLSLKTRDVADHARKRYDDQYQVALRRGDVYRLSAAGFFALLIVLTASLLIHKLRRSAAALQHERELSEQLLLNVLPKPIADRLKQTPEVIADSFPTVTVLFADLVGFSQLSAKLPAIDLVRLLNRIFSALDLLAQKHGLEKIKTIGDAYMVVAGLPIARADHAEAMAEFALSAISTLDSLRSELPQDMSFRIGINSGSVVAGVIGLRKFSYDLWGHTVNLASRMEMHGIPGAIHCAESTYELLKNRYEFVPRGPIPIKGIGPQTTYLLQKRKAVDPAA